MEVKSFSMFQTFGFVPLDCTHMGWYGLILQYHRYPFALCDGMRTASEIYPTPHAFRCASEEANGQDGSVSHLKLVLVEPAKLNYDGDGYR